MFDAIHVPNGSHVKTLRSNRFTRFRVREAFGYNKAIDAIEKGFALDKDVIREVEGVTLASTSVKEGMESYGVVTLGRV